MTNPDRHTARNVANTLADMLRNECVSKKEIAARLREDAYMSDEDMEYFDLKWLEEDD